MPKRITRYHTKQAARRPIFSRFLPGIKFVGYFLGTAIIALTLYELFFMVRLTVGMSAEKETPEYFVRLEIVNASGEAKAAGTIADEIRTMSDAKIDIEIVGTSELSNDHIEKTLIISRDKNTKVARMVAVRLGLDEAEVVYHPPLENDNSPDLTLVLGENIKNLLEAKQATKET